MRGCNMDEFYNTTVTVYNQYKDNANLTDVWYPTVLHNARLLVNKGANLVKSGLESADSAKLHIRMLDGSEKPYKEPKEWLALEGKDAAYTFQQGDFFVKGDTTSEDPSREDFAHYMKMHYDNCFVVTTVDSYILIPHIEVGGK